MGKRGTGDIRTYPAVFTRNGDSISVEYPDLPGCVTCAHSEEEAAERAKEALEGETRRPIPGEQERRRPTSENGTSAGSDKGPATRSRYDI